MLVDSHCHLDFQDFPDLDEVLDRARAAGVGRFVTIGVSKPEFPQIIEIAERYDDVDFALAVHPHEAEKEEQAITVEELIALSHHPKAIGIGEAGLDYFYDYAPRDVQQECFRKHILACKQTGLPLIIHTRDAEDDTIRLLREEREAAREGEAPLSGILHCFSSNRAMAEYGLEIGFYLSFSGMITFKKSENVREIARDIPLDRLLVETDAPFLAPVPYRGKRCEPAHVVETAKCLAEIKGVSFEEIERATTENFFRLFRKAVRA